MLAESLHTVVASVGQHIPQLRDIWGCITPPKGLEAHSLVSTQQPVLLFHRQVRVKPVQQQLSHSRLSKVFDAPIQPTLEEVRVVVA